MKGIHLVFANILFAAHMWCTEDFDKAHLTNSWAVHIENGNDTVANKIAEKHGFVNIGKIGNLPGYFHFMHKKRRRHRRDVKENKTFTLLSDEKVKWVEQQHVLERDKRSIVPEYVPVIHPEGYLIQDPLFSEQWYLNNVGQASGPSTLDINVLPVWSRGISGKNVVVAILDDGLDHTHPDLRRNYDPVASYDFIGYDEDPMPRSSDPNNCHGTKCAGEVAAEAGNGVCGVGVAFNSSVAGIRMLDGNVTDTIEGSALSYKNDYIDIYSCAWGPKDDGKRFGRPGTLASKALELGAKEGRNGLGNIFVWATGNGGLTDDDCNCDGYTTSVYTVSIGAISDHGLSTYYTESCSSTLAVTFSGGSHREKKENKIITTTLNHKCTDEFKGTSSAAPLAAGMVALMLEANSKLTWRDVQHIIVETTFMTSPLDEGWRRNGANKWFNQKFGFGKLDASALVEKASNWTNVADQQICWSDSSVGPWPIPSSGTLLNAMNSSACEGTGTSIRSLEHVQVVISLKHRHRGHLSIELISPSGTRTRLLKTRRNDKSTKGLKDWVFMSVHFWGEDPRGVWTLAVTDNDHNNRQHHRYKSKFGDTEDATEVLQDETNGKDRGEEENTFKSSEDLEDNIFKDSSFKNQKKKKKKGSASIQQESHKLNDNDSLQVLRRKKIKEHMRNKNHIVIKDRQLKMKGSSSSTNDNNNNDEQKSPSKQPVQDDQDDEANSAEQAILEELLGSKSIDDSQHSPATILNATTKDVPSTSTNATSNMGNSKLSNSSSTVASHNDSLHNITQDSNTDTLKTLSNATTMENNSENSQVKETDTKNLENLLRSVLLQILGKQGVNPLEERVSTLESLLGKNKKGRVPDDRFTNGLMQAFKSGKAIDRVNNVLNVLTDSKNDTKVLNTSYSRNADVVVDVLKVLKDVLDTGKNNKDLKGYKQRIANLLEKQSGNTEKLTEKLLEDLKSSRNDSSNNLEVSGNVVNDALALISRVFKADKNRATGKTKISSAKSPGKYRIMFEGPNSEIELPYSSIQNVFKTADGFKQEVTKTSSSKVIHQDDDNVEKITVEHVNVKKGGKSRKKASSRSDKINSALRHAIEAQKKFDTAVSEDTNEKDDSDSDIEMPLKNDGFTLTITKNGEKVGERKVDDLQAIKVLERANNPDITEADKKHFINDDEGNIDVEVVVDGSKNDVKTTMPKNSDQSLEKKSTHSKTINLDLTNDLIPKLVTYDIANKKNTLGKKKKISKTKNDKKKTKDKKVVEAKHLKRKNETENYSEQREENPFFSFDNEPNFPILPGMESDNYIPQNTPSISNYNFPFPATLPSYKTFASLTNKYPENSFESPIQNPPFSVSKRSELMNYGYNAAPMTFPFFPFPRANIPLVPNYPPSFDLYTGETDTRRKRDTAEDYSESDEEFSDDEMENFENVFFPDNNNIVENSKRGKRNVPQKEEIEIEPETSELLNTTHKRKRQSLSESLKQEPSYKKSVRRRRSLDLIDDNTGSEDRKLVRQKRLLDDGGENNDGEDDGPHVVKRSAIISELYPSKQPALIKRQSMESDAILTAAEKRSAIRKALELEKILKQKLFSMKKESSSALDIIKRVHTDIATSDSRDLRLLEKELANMNSGSTTAAVATETTAPGADSIINNNDMNEGPINNFIKLIEQTENSSQRKNIPDDQKQDPDEYYKYGTSTSGILSSWTIKFHGTNS